MENAEGYLSRWQSAGLLDEGTAARIREFEAAQEKPAGRQWQVLLALILGGILLGAGVPLFVAAHWDAVSPPVRILLVLSMLVFFHGLALSTRQTFPSFATGMHALGTVSSGAAIALIGQIFNMQEHWPTAVLVWALCAGAGWYLLRDVFQQTLTLLLVPAWIVCEFCYWVEPYKGSTIYVARLLLVLAAVYLGAFLHARQRALFGILFGVGAVMAPVAVGMLAEGWEVPFGIDHWGFVPLSWRMATALLLFVIGAVALFLDRRASVPVATAIVLAYAVPWARSRTMEDGFHGATYVDVEPNLVAHALVSLATVVLVLWGHRIASKVLVNYGIGAFAVSVMWFYFSNVMGKLDRALGLMLLGVLFLVGGWALERTRRRLLSGMDGGVA